MVPIPIQNYMKNLDVCFDLLPFALLLFACFFLFFFVFLVILVVSQKKSQTPKKGSPNQKKKIFNNPIFVFVFVFICFALPIKFGNFRVLLGLNFCSLFLFFFSLFFSSSCRYFFIWEM